MFKRSQPQIRPLAKAYNAAAIKWLVNEWDATYAVGGLLRYDGKAYAGVLEIYDAAGKQVFRKEYALFRGYYDLLGDFAVDAMTFFGDRPSAALSAHLRQPRCTQRQSVVDLGKAAFLPERSKQEFGLYDKILHRDPRFAEVRYWYANQKQWDTGDRASYMAEEAKAMDAYLLEAPLGDFNPPDPALAAKYPGWVKQAAALVGEDSPTILKARMAMADRAGAALPLERLAAATAVAAKYPNSYWLLDGLAKAYIGGIPGGSIDPAMSLALGLAATRSRFLTGTGDKGPFLVMTDSALIAGDPDLAWYLSPFAGPQPPEPDQYPLWRWLGYCLAQRGQNRQAAEMFMTATRPPGIDAVTNGQAFLNAGVCYALLGQTKALDDILANHRDALKAATADGILDAYAALLEGRPLTTKDVGAINASSDYDVQAHRLFLRAQVDLLNGTGDWRADILTRAAFDPWDRRLWFLYDAYERRTPTPNGHGFYSTIEWFAADEPWVAQALADYRARVGATPPPPIDYGRIEGWLAPFSADRWPHATADRRDAAQRLLTTQLPPTEFIRALRGLLDRRQYDQALTLALRFHHAAVDSSFTVTCGLANRAIHRIESLRASPATRPGTRPSQVVP